MSRVLTVCDVSVRRDAQGRFSLNDLHRAAGGEARHRPSRWAENQQTQQLIDELQTEAGIPALVSQQGGNGSGTYVVRELVYAYAMWISPAFNLKVIRAYDAAQVPSVAVSLNDPATLRHLLLDYSTRVERLEAQAKAAEPDLRAFDELAKAGGSLCLRDSAKAVGMGEHAFVAFLRAQAWIYRRPGAAGWHAYSTALLAGRLVHKVFTVPLPANAPPEAMPKIREQVRMTPKGLTEIARLIKAAAEPVAGLAAREKLETFFEGVRA